jgi:hypothetical protein
MIVVSNRIKGFKFVMDELYSKTSIGTDVEVHVTILKITLNRFLYIICGTDTHIVSLKGVFGQLSKSATIFCS